MENDNSNVCEGHVSMACDQSNHESDILTGNAKSDEVKTVTL